MPKYFIKTNIKNMRKLFFILIAILGLFSCNENTQSSSEATVIGLNEFDSKASEFVGKEVEVTGIVDHVCKHGGKKVLLVSDSASLHINSETRFDEKLTGEKMSFVGIVEELVIDEAYCQKLEEDDIQSHAEGEEKEKIIAMRFAQAEAYRDSMEKAGVNKLSFYSLKYVSHKKAE